MLYIYIYISLSLLNSTVPNDSVYFPNQGHFKVPYFKAYSDIPLICFTNKSHVTKARGKHGVYEQTEPYPTLPYLDLL